MLGASAVAMSSCKDAPGPMDDPQPTVNFTMVENGNFENGLAGWQVAGDESAAILATDGCDGEGALKLTGTATVSRSLSGIPDGIYSLIFYYKNEGGQPDCYIEANGRKTSPAVSSSSWAKGFVHGVKVEGGKCEIRIVSTTDDGKFCEWDGLRLSLTDKDYFLIKGGDISELNYVEANGGKYYQNGKVGDCLEILKANGMNLVRLRLYNDPGKYTYDGVALPEGVQDEADILALARRAKAAGMQILLTFHYSDTWTNGGVQFIPHAWEGQTAEQMAVSLHDFTYAFMEKMKAQGTSPEYVSLGNETQAGMLYPLGGPLGGPLDGNYPDYRTSCQNIALFYNAGYNAVKESNPESRVIIHLAGAGDESNYTWYFGLMKSYNVSYDIIGSSYYPYWTKNTAKQACDFAQTVTEQFDKDLIFMETGYAWSKTIDDGITDGQLNHNGPYKDMSKLGQKNFMLELINEIKKVPNLRVLGFVYWDPIFIPAGSAGWALGQKNIVSNSALFDFSGNALEVLDAFKNNN